MMSEEARAGEAEEEAMEEGDKCAECGRMEDRNEVTNGTTDEAASKEMGVQEEGEQEMEATSTNIQEGKLEHQPRYIKGETADTAVTSDNVEGGSGAVVGEGVEGDSGAVGEGVVGGSGALGEGVEGDSSAVGEGVVGDSGAVVGEGVEGDSGAVVGEGVDRGSGAVGEGVVGGSGAVGEGVVGGSSAVGEGVEGDSSAVGEDVEGDSGALGEGVEGDSGAFGEGVEGDSGALGEGVEGDSGAVGEGVEGSNSDTTGGEGVKGASGDVGEGVQSVEGGGGEEVAKSEEEVRLWAAVKANPAEFTSWTSLLQIVEQKGVLRPAREVFEEFLRFYPYCYGYWKKYVDLVKKLCGGEPAREVLDRGVAAIPLSVDLWLHYASFAIAHFSDSAQGEELVRSVYERAVQSCGLDYRSAKIWDLYIDWESGSGRQRRVMALYDRLLALPTKELPTHLEKFKKLLESTPTSQLLSEEEYQEVSSQAGDVSQGEAVLDGYVRKVTLERRAAVFEKAMAELEKRRQFEDTIKRPYFHVKPLERAQLKNWRDYLDFEIAEGHPERVAVLFERCMIACALYEDFWIKYSKFAEVYIPERACAIYRRACAIHLPQKPNIHMSWAALEEKNGNVDTARQILANIDAAVPGLVQVRLRRIGLEVRAGNYPQADSLYQQSLAATVMSVQMRNFYAWRYARFADKMLQDHSKAVAIMSSAIETDPSNSKLYLQLLDLHTSGHAPPDMPAAEALFHRVAASARLSEEVKESFVLRRQQLLEEFGGNISDVLEVTEACEQIKKSTRKRTASEIESDPAKRPRVEPLTMAPPTPAQEGVAAPLTPEQQQWAAYQQQWGAYNYAQQQQQGYNYQGYYPPYSYNQPPHT